MIDLNEYLQIEERAKNIDDITIHGVPLWRLVRTFFRWKYRDSRPFSVKPKINYFVILRNSFVSCWGFLGILVKRKHYDNVFFPHPRLFFVNGLYMERLSDPLIDCANIADDTIVFERHQNGIHQRPRIHSNMVVYLDFIDLLSKVLSPVAKKYISRKYKVEIEDLYERLNNVFRLNDKSYVKLFEDIVASFIISRYLIKPIIKCISPKRVFIAPRGTYDYAISICKNLDVKIIELQHGVGLGISDLDTGRYDSRIDPDFLFVFGSANIADYLGYPLDRIINIGYPFKTFLKSSNDTKYAKTVSLVISEPHITDLMIKVLIGIIEQYPDYEFHYRCHPQESLNSIQKSILSQYKQIKCVDNKTESFCTLSRYEAILGENSSVLFEAMSLHKKVGRLNYGGFRALETKLLHGGTIINSPQEFDLFMRESYSDENDAKEVYSDFQPEALKVIGL